MTSSTGSENELRPIRALLIEAPGEDTLKENRDLFVKRGMVQAMCTHCAAAGLFTLQIHAPNGGRGHFPSLRKGGEITTLIAFTPNEAAMTPALWRDIACNILETSSFRVLCDATKTELKFCFPWLSTVEDLQGEGGQTWPLDVHPAHLFWPMPRRIRLDFDTTTVGACDVCGAEDTPVLTRYFTWPGGLNYNGESTTEKAARKQAGSSKKPRRTLFPNWLHPLTPYEKSQTGNLLPLSLDDRGFSYRYWLGCALGVRRRSGEVLPATVVHVFRSSRVDSGQLRLRAFGYDVDNMKARCWYETTFPLFDLVSDRQSSQDLAEVISSIVDPLILAAETASAFLIEAVRDSRTKPSETQKRDPSWREAARRNVAFCEASFWSRTESTFFVLVKQAIALARQHGRDGFDKSEPLRREWLQALRSAALDLFDEAAARGNVGASDPSKLAAAHNNLRDQLFGRQLQQTLGLISAAQAGANGERRGRRKRVTSPVEAQ